MTSLRFRPPLLVVLLTVLITALLAVAPSSAPAATAGWVLNPGDRVTMPWPSYSCDASNLEGTYVYSEATYLSREPYYRYILFYYLTPANQRAVLDLTYFFIENRAPFKIRVYCTWP